MLLQNMKQHRKKIFVGASIVYVLTGMGLLFLVNCLLGKLLMTVYELQVDPEQAGYITSRMWQYSFATLLFYLILGAGFVYIQVRYFYAEPLEELEKMTKNVEETQSLMIQQEKLASIGHLAAGVAHELNNPIGFVNSNVNALKDYVPEMKKYISYLESHCDKKILENHSANDIEFILEDIPDLVDESLDGLKRVTSIVKSLKNYARVDLEDRIDYNINEGIEATLTVSRNTYKYVANIHKDLTVVPLLVANGNQINEVLLNIFVNAAQAIEEQGPKDKGNIYIKTYNDQNYVYCEIRDDGPGIPTSIITKIFDPFFTTKEPGKGTGLGLNIAYNTINSKHDGDLTVHSVLGQGTTFKIALPIIREVSTNG